MSTAADYIEQIDTQVYRLLQTPMPAGNAPVYGAGTEPARKSEGAQNHCDSIEWDSEPPLGEYQSPKQIAKSLYQWLLPIDRMSPGVTPEVAASLLRCSYPSEAEILAIVGFASAAARPAPELEAKAELIRRALGVRVEFVNRLNDAVDRIVRDIAGKGRNVSARTFLSEPPKALVDGIATAIASVARPRAALASLSAPVYQHPADHLYQTQLSSIPLLSNLVAWFASYSSRAGHLKVLGRGFEVTENAVPVVFRAFRAAGDALGISELPPLFMSTTGFTPGVGGLLSAETFGVDTPYISISQGAASALDSAELTFLLGRELGHIQSQHVRYRGIAKWLLRGADTAAAVTVGLAAPLADATIRPLLAAYFRATALTADRAGLLAVQSREAALRVMCKQSGYPFRDANLMKTRAIIEQVIRRKDQTSESLFSRLFDVGSQYAIEEPMIVDRVIALLEWMDEGGYSEILQSTPGQLKSMAERRDKDSKMQSLTDTAIRVLTAWGSDRFMRAKSEIGPLVRRMFYEHIQPDLAIAPILRVELIVNRSGVNHIAYDLAVLFSDQGKPKIATIGLDVPSGWDAAPDGIRQDIIRHGGKKHVRLLYPITN